MPLVQAYILHIYAQNHIGLTCSSYLYLRTQSYRETHTDARTDAHTNTHTHTRAKRIGSEKRFSVGPTATEVGRVQSSSVTLGALTRTVRTLCFFSDTRWLFAIFCRCCICEFFFLIIYVNRIIIVFSSLGVFIFEDFFPTF